MLISKEQVSCIKCGNSLSAHFLKGRPLKGLTVKCECGCSQVYLETNDKLGWIEVK